MTTAPDQHMIDRALQAAAQSPCRSKRGVVLYDMRTGAFRGAGFNGPPGGCPGRAVCAGACGQRAVHAEVRALREAEVYRRNGNPPGPYDLIHVELAADGGVVACSGPSCPGCAAHILDVGFVGGVWLYEAEPRGWYCIGQIGHEHHRIEIGNGACHLCGGTGWRSDLRKSWRRYGTAEFYEVSMRGVRP
jgi:hypothetical protein